MRVSVDGEGPNRLRGLLIRTILAIFVCLIALLTAARGNVNAVDPSATIPISASGQPWRTRINESTNRLYMTVVAQPWHLEVVDLTSQTSVATIPTPNNTEGLAVSETTNLVYVAVPDADSLMVIDGSTNLELPSVALGQPPTDVAVNQSTKTVYVSSESAGTVSVLDGSTHSTITAINLPNAGRMVVDEARDRVYVSRSADDVVSVIDGSTNQVVDEIAVGDTPTSMALDVNGGQLFVVNEKTDLYGDVSVVDVNTLTETTRLPVRGGEEIVFHPESNTVWVTKFAYAVILDASTFERRRELYLVDWSRAVQADGDSSLVYFGLMSDQQQTRVEVYNSACGFEDSDGDGEGDQCDSGWEEADITMGIDVDVSGNTATSLGPTDVCRSVSTGNTFEIDLVVYGLPESVLYSMDLYFDPTVLRVVDNDPEYIMLSGPGSPTIYDVSEWLPDEDGKYRTEALRIAGGPGPSGASGTGVLVRITLEALASGYSPLALGQTYVADTNNQPIWLIPRGAIIWVDDACPTVANDNDSDGVLDSEDICPFGGDPDQTDRDVDGYGDWCDDGDRDSLLDVVDPCPFTGPSDLLDADGDSVGDLCDPDRDGDGIANSDDNAPGVPNPGQEDTDGDGTPDVLDVDVDGDGTDDKTIVSSITADIDGDGDQESVEKTQASLFYGTDEVGFATADAVRVHVFALQGSMHVVDLDGDGEDEVVIKDPGQPPGLYQSYDIHKSDPDTDIDIIVLGGGSLGALVPAPVDVDSDGELESQVWEPELAEGSQVDSDLDADGDVDVQWANIQIAGFDNCPLVANPGQENFDGDGYGNACDGDDDNDGYADVAEASIGTGSLSPCGIDGWPSDLVWGSIPESTNKVNIADLSSFVAPVRYLGTDVGAHAGDERWDLSPGPGLLPVDINVLDLSLLVAGPTGYPPMLGGARAFAGPVCPYAP